MNAALLALLIPFFAAGIPIAISIVMVSVISLYFFTNIPLVVVPQRLFVGLDSFPLMAIPFFILAGNLMSAGGISERLVNLAKAVVGQVRGGLACTCVLTCLMFASVSGSSVATTFAIGAILIPAMVKHGYPKAMAAAIQASSAELGVLIPPSIPLILYGVSTNTSIGKLFTATILPGMFIAVALLLFIIIWVRVRDLGRNDADNSLSFWRALKESFGAIMMPVIILGGIYGGIFTPTEASAVAVVYALVIGGLVYRKLSIADLISVFKRTAISSSTVMLIISAASLFSFLIGRSELPEQLSAFATSQIDSQIGFLLAINLLLFMIGMFVETSAAILILAPILVPVAMQFGVDPVHFGIIMVVNLALGMFTPPLGVNLFAACQVANLAVEKIVPELIPFVLVVISCLFIITWFPGLSLWLPSLIYP